ncbi:hypothetical protein KP509_20G012400 [Ceratopteris richardii]|uniref:Probable alanine--tRNA ligase, chloroplastic n=2 Tax=Ceratopteris richardii TaxID=49495 RepID=A0A8T2SGE2_CERRI|nr:hypothetical protein KP509_20G012400 [Ceratopteris richardii]
MFAGQKAAIRTAAGGMVTNFSSMSSTVALSEACKFCLTASKATPCLAKGLSFMGLGLNHAMFHLSSKKTSLRPSRRPVMWIRNFSAAVETAKEEQTETRVPIDSSVTGDAIRRRFLEFYASRAHKILPGSSLVPDDPTVLLTIAGMLQFKPIFLGQAPRQVPRATTSQKCIRTNDIENVGRTARHHTFFEMLGNFSFGDYFKKDAIKWAWELATEEFKLPIDRLWVSIFQDDDEAFTLWRDEAGVQENRILRMGEEDNFWSSGSTGPCGPCSELYYDFYPERGTENVDLGDDSRFIEFYNLVFMQYNRKEDGALEPLRNKNIDTGLGLERLAQILQKVPNNYETDLIYPIMEYAANLAGLTYRDASENSKTYLKVIGDHSRAVVYLISDGVTPSNIGRGYIVRRLIRRVVRMGRLLGIKGDGQGDIDGAFLPAIAKVVIDMSSNVDPDVQTNSSRIFTELHKEEIRFVQTLERGEKLLEQLLQDALAQAIQPNSSQAVLSGKDVFMLYDTFGFPIEITEEVAAERGVSIDRKGFEAEMEVQRQQSQAAHNTVKLYADGALGDISSKVPLTEFLGYSTLQSSSNIVALLLKGLPVTHAPEGSEVEIILDQTPFYAESGGQIGDNGILSISGTGTINITDVQKIAGGLFLHKGIVQEGTIEIGGSVDAVVNSRLRQRAQAHHTATHLLQSALKKIIGDEVSQAGSLVAFDRLRFDFNLSRPVTEDEISKIEDSINEWIGMGVSLQTRVMTLTDAKRSGAIAMFGEKYGEEVRVVEVPGISLELCGGTHVSNTSEIQGFRIISEQGIASGVRRIEAVAGPAFVEYAIARDRVVRQLSSLLKVKAEDLPARISVLLDDIRSVRGEASSLQAKVAMMKAEVLGNSPLFVGSFRLVVGVLDSAVDVDSLRTAAEHVSKMLGDMGAVVLGNSMGEGKVSIVASFGPKVVEQGLNAGKFVGMIARICGGGGGGRPNFAQAGGKMPEKLPEALQKAKDELQLTLSKKS